MNVLRDVDVDASVVTEEMKDRRTNRMAQFGVRDNGKYDMKMLVT